MITNNPLRLVFTGVLCCLCFAAVAATGKTKLKWFAADNKAIRYTGRIDFSHPQQPRFWQPGVYFSARFKGSSCAVVITDEMRYGSKHNYIEVVVDNQPPYRIQTKGKTDTIQIAAGLAKGIHSFTICKNTEANIGYLQVEGIVCEKLLPAAKKELHAMEFIGDSITCGTGSDLSGKGCGQGAW